MIFIHYLDNAATSRPSDNVIRKVNELLEVSFANPSSRHVAGLAAAREVEAARERVAALLGCMASEVTFTSGGTEGNNMAIFGATGASRCKKVITTEGEHPSVSASFDELERRGYEVVRLPVASGAPDMEKLGNALDKNTALVSMMLVNNETGALYPVQQIRAIAQGKGLSPLIHTDAVQATGKIPFSVTALKVDLLTASAHKIGGIKGCGALYVAKGVHLASTVFGGGQERGVRSGTLNAPAIAAFGVAAADAKRDIRENYKKASALRERMKKQLGSLVIWNSPEGGSPYVLSIAIPGCKAENLLHFLEAEEIYVSAGSACSSRKQAVSSVLLASGVPHEIADSTIRVSLSKDTADDDIDALCKALLRAAEELRRL